MVLSNLRHGLLGLPHEHCLLLEVAGFVLTKSSHACWWSGATRDSSFEISEPAKFRRDVPAAEVHIVDGKIAAIRL